MDALAAFHSILSPMSLLLLRFFSRTLGLHVIPYAGCLHRDSSGSSKLMSKFNAGLSLPNVFPQLLTEGSQPTCFDSLELF